MAKPLTISNAPLEHPGMDYAFLRQEGIKLIEKLASSRWTDYNAHDPGITILEALCYAITDLSYRLSFTMEDLLAFPASKADPPSLFLTARDILTVDPLTLNDYRKLLLDIDIDINGRVFKAFKNAWLEPIKAPQPAIFYDANNAKLTFSNLDSFNITEPIHLKGLYRVLLEKEKGLPFQDSKLIEAAKTKLNQHRNLCEDFDEIKVLGIEQITVRTEIEIADHVDANQLMAKLYAALDRTISPSIDFLSLSDLRKQGIPIEDIFAGPKLKHGFIDDAQLAQFQRQTELHTSDLIHVILDLPGVKTVRSITIASDQSPTPQTWALDLKSDLTPQLKSLADILKLKPTNNSNGEQKDKRDITFYKGQIVCQIDPAKVEKGLAAIYQTPASQPTSASTHDIPIPTGNYRELSEYETIQSEFPMVYGIGEAGLPSSVSSLRKAQAKQLQAYLMVFDQILANYFAQLDHVRDLFTLGNAEAKTYFTQSIAHFPGATDILKEANEQYLEKLQEDPAVALDRKNRLLDHLIAQYGETFIDYSLLYPGASLSDAAIQHKANFAKDYCQVSAGRGQAINYTLDPNQSDNVSGLKRRIARLLGIEPDRRSLGSGNDEGFYLVEHILLRPRQHDKTIPSVPVDQTASAKASASEGGENTATNADRQSPQISNDFLSFSKEITEFIRHTNSTIICTSAQHGLKPKDTINIIYSRHYNGTHTVLDAQKDTFEIKADFVADSTPERDAWVRQDQYPDPFSLQISVVLPDSPPRFHDPNFKQLINDTLISETPAHITLYIHWFDQTKMADFEREYNLLLQDLSGTAADNSASQAAAKAASTRLINFLTLGSTDIPAIPALIGYMVIGDHNASSSAPQFVVV